MTGLEMSAELITAREEALFNPIRRHEADGFVEAPAADQRINAVRQFVTGATRSPDAAMILPADPAERKNLPITTGVLDYFPKSIAEVARVSKAGGEQHHPGQPLHWDKSKSMDHADCISRHLIDRGRFDSDGMRHSAKLAWRALALLEIELENESKVSASVSGVVVK